MKTYDIIQILHRIAFGGALLAAVTLLPACEDDPAVPDEELSTDPGKSEEPESLHLIDYNILEGMKLDKGSNFDNFVTWVQKKDPDIMTLCECNNFTEESLKALSTRYGHPYAVLCKETGFPVAITSKYPIELRNRMLDGTPLWHGALHVRIKNINVVALHLYPFGKYPNSDAGAAGSGDAYRDEEIGYILDNTIRRYPTEPFWVMCGDFNSYSPKDEEVLGDQYYNTHKTVLGSGYHDALRDRHSVFFRTVPTVYGGWNGEAGRRIDFIYASQGVMREIDRSEVLYDDFTDTHSDHYPVMIEFRHYPSEN